MIKKNLLVACYRKYRTRVSKEGSYVLSFFGYLFDSIIVLLIGIILGLIIKSGLISFSLVFQSWLLIIFTLRLTYNKSFHFDISPFITLPISKIQIAAFYLKKELYSEWAFLTFPFLVPILYINNLLSFNALDFISFLIIIYLIGIVMILVSNYTLMFGYQIRTIISITIAYINLTYIYLSIRNDFFLLPIFNKLMNQPVLSLMTLMGICLFLWIVLRNNYKTVIYQLFENQIYKKDLLVIDSTIDFITKNYFVPLHFKELIRCKGFYNQLRTMVTLIFTGIIFYIVFDYKELGLCLTIGSYAFSMAEYSILRDSSYFDAIHTKPISLDQLLTADYFLTLIISMFYFIISLGCVFFFDPDKLLLPITIYFIIIGPTSFMLFQIAVYSNKRFDPFGKILGNNKGDLTEKQWIIRFIAGLVTFILVLIISFSPDFVSYLVIIFSIFFIIIHHIWLRNVCNRFERFKYAAMEQFRFQ